ncbi:MAG: hypothetical protein ACKOPT_06085 [Cyanobium sp.]
MFFRKQKFFLDLTDQQGAEADSKAGQGKEVKITIAPPPAAPAVKKEPAVKEEKAAAKGAPAQTAPVSAPAAPAAPPAPVAQAAVRTTAEDIAAQLAAEAASRPAPTMATFAPDCLVPGAGTPRRRRSAGANLGAFKEIARGLMKS